VDTLTVHTLAEVLKEPNKELLGRVLRRLGQERCSQVLTDALALEASGGMLTKDGTRRRTPGGTFFQLVRDRCTGRERHRIFASQATPGQSPWPQSQAQAPSPAPVDLTFDLWKGLRPMPVTATLID
jgi:hypothetical protein